jgi:hypothetical protein
VCRLSNLSVRLAPSHQLLAVAIKCILDASVSGPTNSAMPMARDLVLQRTCAHVVANACSFAPEAFTNLIQIGNTH